MGDVTQESSEHEVPVIIVGGGPVGMMTAFELSRLRIKCLLAEQSLETTKWPKMDLTNCRSMEIMRMLGIADEYRAQNGAVSGDSPFDSLFYTSCGPGGKAMASWQLPPMNEWRDTIAKDNDGTYPAEPGQRCSQIVLEAWLKKKCLAQPSINSKFGWKYISHIETSDGVEATFIDCHHRQHLVRSKYLVGADGGSSRVRKNSGIKMLGGPLPIALFLVHFRSQDLAQNLPFGKFWHMFPPFGGFIIDQDEEGTFTAHMALDSLDQDTSKIDPYEWVYKCFGGAGEPYRFKIDEILVSSAWRPNFSIAEHYLSPGGRIILAGDACHRNPPHGGLGMNSGIEDALAVSWRLSAVLKGYGGPHLIPSYEAEQRPVMITRLERCNHWVGEHIPRYQWFGENGPEVLMAENEKGDQLRQQIKDFLDKSGSECLDRGIELDSRYKSAVIFQDGTKEPEWEFKKYFPSTLPGSRAPHVFLKDGKTSILDTYGPEFTLVTFTSGEEAASTEVFVNAAKEMKMELKTVVLRNEEHAHKIWGSNLILIRADGHVAWRSQEVPDREAVKDILQVVTGQKIFPGYVPAEPRAINIEGITSVSTEKYTDTELLALGESI